MTINLKQELSLTNYQLPVNQMPHACDALGTFHLIPRLMQMERGVCKGQKEIHKFLEEVAKSKPPVRKYYRKGFFTNGKTFMWEYPRESPSGDQMDFVEVMEIKDGLIWHHRVYWGWMGFKVIQENAYHR